MQKTILLTGATDGIGLATARLLVEQGHNVLLHGRNPEKLKAVENDLSELAANGGGNAGGNGGIESYVADLSRMADVKALANAIAAKHSRIDVLINNAGVLSTPDPITQDGLDVRFAVNTIAPYLLTQKLLPLMDSTGRVVNLSSAAQAPVNIDALAGGIKLADMEAYSQSKLAITMWSRDMALKLKGFNENGGPIIVAVNPGSLLASKMVKEGFGVAGKDIGIGADILVRAALSDEFANASGQYFDNDSGQFASPHRDALDQQKSEKVVEAIESVLGEIT